MGFVMRKFLFCFLIFNLFFINSSLISESTIYSPDIEIDQSFTYEIITSSLDVTHKRKHFVVEDVFQFGLQQFSISNPIEISVINYTDSYVNFTLSCQGSNFSLIDPLDPALLYNYYSVYLSHFLFFPQMIASSFAYDYIEYGNFNSSYFAIGLQLGTFFFFSTNSTVWISIQEILSFLEDKDNYNINSDDFDVVFSYLDSDGLIYIEGWYSGDITYSNVSTVVNSGFQLVFNKTSGVLQGLRIKGSVDGIYGDFRSTCYTEFHMELLNYDLPEFSLYNHITPVFGSYMFYFGLVLIPIIIIRKKCERK